ncbi:MAG: flagellar hook capping FlgD N-terminal domain-containing protein [Parvularculaceae bacterium]
MTSVSPVQTQTSAAANASANAKTENSALSTVDFQNFLTLLTTQLRNQDPLDPADSTEFVAQLAQFTSVEQLVNVNSKIDKLASALVSDGLDKYSGWIGKEAEANNALAYFDGASAVKYRLPARSEAAYVDLVVTDKTGAEVARVRTLNSDALQTWDGKVNGAPVTSGAYAVTAQYFDRDDNLIDEAVAKTYGEVREVRFDNGDAQIVLNGGIKLTPDQVTGLGVKS